MLNNCVEARFCLVRAQLLKTLGNEDEADNAMCRAYEYAHTVGWHAYSANTEMPEMLKHEKLLAQAWTEGREEAEFQVAILDERAGCTGSQQEWDALPQDEQIAHWDEFHDRCAIGTADDMYFYHVMMNMHMVGYVGH